MANQQLVEYIKEQLQHRSDPNQIRTVLATQGWMPQDVEDAFAQASEQRHWQNREEHHTNYVAIVVLAILVLGLGIALLLVVYNNADPEVLTTPQPRPPIPEPPAQQLSGWVACQQEIDSQLKDDCYYKLNLDNEEYDCEKVTDPVERRFCYRAKETVVLERYNQGV